MNLLRKLIRFYLYGSFYLEKWFKQGSFGTDQAVFIRKENLTMTNRTQKEMIKYHVKQFHESSCSVATIAGVVNTLLEINGDTPLSPITQQDLLQKVTTAHWAQRMSDDGYQGKRGLPLFTLGQVVKDSLTAFGISGACVETVQASQNTKMARKIKQVLYHRLERFESQGSCLIIAHFDQGSFLKELHIPHISPVGGFSPVSGRITILDVDSCQPNPYQVSFDTFYRGISHNYNPVFRMYGYGEGGYVFIDFKEQNKGNYKTEK